MATTTPNIGLTKPDSNEYYNISVFNGNADILDTAVNSLNTSINNKANKSVTYTATLTAAGWTGSGPYTQTVTVTGIASTDEPIVDVSLSSDNATAAAELEAWAMVSKITTSTNSITAVCLDDKPEVNLNIRLKVVF